MRVLVSGCKGSIGYSLGNYASDAGYEVLGLGRSSQPLLGWSGRYVQADVAGTDLSSLIKEFHPDVFLHAAGAASVGDSINRPFDDFHASVLPWINVLEGVRRSGVRPVIIFPSSAAVYGDSQVLPVSEKASIAPISPYGYHKVACELIAAEYAQCYGLNIIVCRLFSTFGEAQRRLLVWELFERFANCDPEVWLHGTGKESRDYLHINDVARAVFGLAVGQMTSNTRGECLTINVASGQETEIVEIARLIGELFSPTKPIKIRGGKRPGDPLRWHADISMLRTRLPQWTPEPLSMALSTCVSFWRNTQDSNRESKHVTPIENRNL